jgi:hypothetical protein
MFGLDTATLSIITGALSSLAVHVAGAFMGMWREGRQREQDRFDKAMKVRRAADDSSARAAADDNRDPGASSRRLITFVFVVCCVPTLALAAILGITVNFEVETFVPSSWFGIIEGYATTKWVSTQGLSFPLWIVNLLVNIVCYFFGYGMAGRTLRRFA